MDALLEADKALRFSESIHDANEFVKLDDTLLKTIENYGDLGFRRPPPLLLLPHTLARPSPAA